jgi:hypothetical protein
MLILIDTVLNLHRLLSPPSSNFVSLGATEMRRSIVVYVDRLYPISFSPRMMLKFRGYSRNVVLLPKWQGCRSQTLISAA